MADSVGGQAMPGKFVPLVRLIAQDFFGGFEVHLGDAG